MNFKTLCLVGITASSLAAVGPSIDTKPVAPGSKPAAKVQAKPASGPNGAKVEAIKQMLAVSGTVRANVEAAHDSIKSMRKNSPNINPKFWDELDKTVTQAGFEQILVGIYDHAYTLEEIKGITKFYASPAGRAFLEKNGKALQESGRSMQAFMEGNSKELMKKYGQPAQKAEPKKN